MYDIFEKPWGLLVLAFVTLLVVQIIYVFSQKGRWWHFMLPVVVAILAFGLDLIVKTDLEKIKCLLKTAIEAAEQENVTKISTLISPDYKDPVHSSKDRLISYCRRRLRGEVINKNTLLNSEIEISAPEATVLFKALTKFDEESVVSDYGQGFMLIKMRLRLVRGQNEEWLIVGSEILEINNRQVGWGQIR